MEFFKDSPHRIHLVRDYRPLRKARLETWIEELKMKLRDAEAQLEELSKQSLTTRCECCNEPPECRFGRF